MPVLILAVIPLPLCVHVLKIELLFCLKPSVILLEKNVYLRVILMSIIQLLSIMILDGTVGQSCKYSYKCIVIIVTVNCVMLPCNGFG
jgi:hypothetical protein